jgi:hypothetical protein
MTTSLQDLMAQQAALNAQIADHERPRVQSALDLLASAGVTSLGSDLVAIRDELPPGVAKNQISNVLTVLTASVQVLAHELARLNSGTVYGGSIMPQVVHESSN